MTVRLDRNQGHTPTNANDSTGVLKRPGPATPTPSPTPGATSPADVLARVGRPILNLSGLVSRTATAAALTPPATSTPAPATPFTTAVRDNFARWDTSRDGFLSRQEIAAAIVDPTNTGEAAAALATLHRQIGDIEEMSNDEVGDENDGVTRADLRVFDREHAAGESRGQTINGWFQHFTRQIGNVDRRLFVGEIDPRAINQGHIGDCYFLAAVAGRANTAAGRQAIRDMITPNRDGTYTVALPGRGNVTVTAPTDAELALFSNAGSNGLWLSVLEKAYGTARNGEGVAWLFPANVATEGADGGASNAEGVTAITGHGTNTDMLGLTSAETTHQRLTNAFANGRVVTAGIRKNLPWIESNRRQGLPTGHVYTVLGYDSAARQITLRNPWGYGEFTDANGRPRDGVNDGVFTLSLDEFNQYFSDVTYEEAR